MKQDTNAVQGHKSPYSAKSATNAINFAIEQALAQIATAVPCKVMAVYKGNTAGYVDVLPLIGTTDGKGEYVAPVTLYHLPYSRIQGGAAALIIDPVIGDIGLAVFAEADASGVTAGTSEPIQPASFRRFSHSDGWYIGGFLNQTPKTFVEVDPVGTVTITAHGGVTINGDVTVNGDVVAKGISLCTHTHGGVETGGGSTSKPN